jgi:hypothetical protein
LGFTFEWSRDGSPISGATDSTYLVGPGDVGHRLEVSVRATDGSGGTGAASAQTAVVTVASPYATSLPIVVASNGMLVMTSPGSWTGSPTSFSYQWLRCASSGADCVAVAGQTGLSYQLTGADDGSSIRLAVTATNAGGVGVASSLAVGQTASVPGAPTGVTAVAGAAQATVSFTAPSSNGGSAISSYTVTASPGGATASGSASPITVDGLSAGVAYTFTVTATNGVGAGPASSSSNAVTPSSPGSSSGSGGGSHGGGGGSNSLAVSITPGSQTITSGGSASWTVTVTNTGGNYVGDVAVSDGTVPGCGQTSGSSPGLGSMAPTVTVSYSCSLAGIAGTVTNTVNVSGIGPAGDTVTASASATVNVTSPPPAPTPSPARKPVIGTGASSPATVLTVSSVERVLLDVKRPLLRLSLRVSKTATLVLTLSDTKGHALSSWREHELAGLHRLQLLLPAKARRKGRELLKIAAPGALSRTVTLTLSG